MINQAASALVRGGLGGLGGVSEKVLKDTASRLLLRLGGKATCAFVFATHDWVRELGELCELVQLYGHAPHVMGCTGAGFIGQGTEVERESGFSMLLLHLPETELHPFEFGEAEIGLGEKSGFWSSRTGVAGNDIDAWIALINPFKFAADDWVAQWRRDYPRIPLVGGLSAGPHFDEGVRVFYNGREIEDGGFVLGLSGGVGVRPMVSQGCRPIGSPLTVTRAEKNIVYTLGSQPAYEALSEAFSGLGNSDRELARGNLFVGVASSEYVDEFKPGDFLVRNLLGADPLTGAVAVGDYIRTGQTVQYHLRDRSTAHEDLIETLRYQSELRPEPFAALMFSCAGRGTSMFKESGHDARAFESAMGDVPLAGFFGNGEIGPVAGVPYLHGYAISAALFTEPVAEEDERGGS